MGLISLTTDFGVHDEYVGVMKGVIWGVSPQSQIVDISHQVAPQDLYEAAFLLAAAYPFFGAGSVHVTVVDPGVGSDRSILAMQYEGHYFIAPDNGIFSLILNGQQPEALVMVNRPEFFLADVSQTFHGRDIFAPVAGYLASGTPLQAIGPELPPEALYRLSPPQAPMIGEGQITGTIVHVDRFGNLTTNICRQLLVDARLPSDKAHLAIRVGDMSMEGLRTCYADVPAGSPLALIGSRDRLEIAVNQGNAQKQLGAYRGEMVAVVW